MQSVVSEFDSKMIRQTAMRSGVGGVSTASMSLRTFGNPTQSYLEFYTYGVMLMAAQIGMILAFSMSMFEEKKRAPSMRSIAAKEILYLMLSVTSVMLAITILSAVFDLPLRADVSRVLTLCAAFLFAVENLAGLAAVLFKTRMALFVAIGFGALLIAMLIRVRWSKAVSTCNHTARD